MKRLSIEPPSEELVTLYLAEIARAYHVPFSGLPKEELHDNDDDEDDEGPPSGRIFEQPISSSSTSEKVRRLSQVSQLPDPDAPKSPVAVSAPGPTTDNPHPVLKISTGTSTSRTNGKVKTAEEKELDALRDRFEALRRR